MRTIDLLIWLLDGVVAGLRTMRRELWGEAIDLQDTRALMR